MEAAIYHGDLPLIIEGPVISRGDSGTLDTATYTALVQGGAGAINPGALARVGGTMFVQSVEEEPEGILTRVTVRLVGLLSGTKVRRRTFAAGREVSVGPDEQVMIAWSDGERGEEEGQEVERVRRQVPRLDNVGNVIYKTIITPSGSADRWNIREAIVAVNITSLTTSEPTMAAVGTSVSPPNAPAVAPYPWGGYNEPLRYNHPSGWVLDDRQSTELFPGLYEVSDTYGYYYGAVPD
jgi:hypothetical protein